jgi:hypothetical protein
MTTNDPESSETLKLCQYLWEEYKYRHDLIWQRIFSFTSAVVLISIIPYIEEKIARLFGPWIITAPLLASLLVGFVLSVIRNELRIFMKIKEAYRIQQNRLLDYNLKHRNEKSKFEWFVMVYFFCLLLLSIINGFIVWIVWLPNNYCTCP